MADSGEHDAVEGVLKSKDVILLRLDILGKQMDVISRKMDVFTEKVHTNEVWKERVENKLASGAEHMGAHDKLYDVLEKRFEADLLAANLRTAKIEEDLTAQKARVAKEFTDQKAARDEDLKQNYISRDMIKWISIGITLAGGSSAFAVFKLLGLHM